LIFGAKGSCGLKNSWDDNAHKSCLSGDYFAVFAPVNTLANVYGWMKITELIVQGRDY